MSAAGYLAGARGKAGVMGVGAGLGSASESRSVSRASRRKSRFAKKFLGSVSGRTDGEVGRQRSVGETSAVFGAPRKARRETEVAPNSGKVTVGANEAQGSEKIVARRRQVTIGSGGGVGVDRPRKVIDRTWGGSAPSRSSIRVELASGTEIRQYGKREVPPGRMAWAAGARWSFSPRASRHSQTPETRWSLPRANRISATSLQARGSTSG